MAKNKVIGPVDQVIAAGAYESVTVGSATITRYAGSGTPENIITAVAGLNEYIDLANGDIYDKTGAGITGWVKRVAVGGLTIAGTWDATGAPPTINNNQYARVSVAGTTSVTTVNLGAVTDWQVGDWLLRDNAGNLHKLDNSDSPSNLALGAATQTTQPITNSNGTGFTIPAAVANSTAVATDGTAGLLSAANAYLLTTMPRGYNADLGVGTAGGTITVTHNLNSKKVIVQIVDTANGDTVVMPVQRNGVNTVVVTTPAAFAAGTYEINVLRV